jgi:hypothetical protein
VRRFRGRCGSSWLDGHRQRWTSAHNFMLSKTFVVMLTNGHSCDLVRGCRLPFEGLGTWIWSNIRPSMNTR